MTAAQQGTAVAFALRNHLYRVRIWLLVNGKKQIKNTFFREHSSKIVWFKRTQKKQNKTYQHVMDGAMTWSRAFITMIRSSR